MFARIKPVNGKSYVQVLDGQRPHVALPKGATVEVFDSVSGKLLPLAQFRKVSGKKGEEAIIIDQNGQEVAITIEHDASVVPAVGESSAASNEAAFANTESRSFAAASASGSDGSDAAAAPSGGGLSTPVIALLAAGLAGGIAVAAGGKSKDKTAPGAPNGLDLATADDSGSSTSDNLTRNASALTIAGTAEAGAKVELLAGNVVLASGTAGTDGVFAIDIALPAGANSASARATDAAGNVGPQSAVLTITVDSTDPVAPTAPDLASADDSGSSNSDNITSQTTGLSISGNAEAGSVVEVLDGTTSIGTVTAGSGGTFSLDVALASGTHAIKARATDLAGNVGNDSSALTITVDAVAPAAPTALDLATADDSGVSNSDNITDQTSGLTISGNAEAGSTVQLFDGATSLGTVTAGSGGAFSLDVSLSAGTHAITAKATDAAGSVSAASAALGLSVAAAPTLVDSSVDGKGDIVTLYFSEALDTVRMPTAAQFAVDNGGTVAVSSVQVNGNRVTLQLASAVTSASPVKVSFSDASAANDTSTLQDVTGNDAASFANAAVANKLALAGTQAADFAPVASIKLTGAEISAYDATSGRFFVTSNAGLQVVKLNADMTLTTLGTIALGTNDVTSVSVRNGIVAASVVDANKTLPGTVYFIKADGDPALATTVLGNVKVGALPDMVTFTADGSKLLVANEGEQDVAGVNPVGSVSVIDISGGIAAATVRTAGFDAFNDKIAALIRQLQCCKVVTNRHKTSESPKF